jgi:Rrf2 family protein
MLKLSKKAEYALIGLLHMVRKAENELTNAKELASTYNIPQELMGKILQKLTKYGLIKSVQGVKGGYCLENSANQVSIGQVLKVIDGPIKIVKCIHKQQDCDCGQLDFCNIKNPMFIIQERIEQFFEEMTLNDLENELGQTSSKSDLVISIN